MGIKDFFSSAGRAKSRTDKHIKTVINPYTQTAMRYESMEALLKDGSDEALIGIFRRFTITSTKSIEDEEEKGWAYRQLSGLGPKVLPAAKAFCLANEQIAWALRIVEDVANEKQEWDILDALLEAHPPGYERDPSTKIQMLTHLSEIEDPSVPEILARYLDDPDETVRFFVAEQLIDIAEPQSRDPLIARLTNPDEDSLRLRTRILEGLATLEWDVADHQEAITKALGSEHMLQGGKVARR